MSTLTERYDLVKEQIKQASRPDQQVTLLAVSKTRSSDEVLSVHQQGQIQFGENYIQEAVDKVHALSDYPIEWHFIGPLQSNKTRLAAENFSWIHTVDRLKIAKRLSDQRQSNLPDLNICLQVNIDDEETKSGFAPNQLIEAALEIVKLPNIKLRGLMAIPKATTDSAQQEKSFREMSELMNSINKRLETSSPNTNQLDTLSMGMSGDMATAIHCGSTIVRIGTAIFGPRPEKTTPTSNT